MYDAFEYVSFQGIALKDSYPRPYIGHKSQCMYEKDSMADFYNYGQVEEDTVPNQRMKEIVSN